MCVCVCLCVLLRERFLLMLFLYSQYRLISNCLRMFFFWWAEFGTTWRCAFRSAHNCLLVCRIIYRWTIVVEFPISRDVSPFGFSSRLLCFLGPDAIGMVELRAQVHMVYICMRSILLDLNTQKLNLLEIEFSNERKRVRDAAAQNRTQWHCNVIAHSKQLTEANDFIFRWNANFLHLFDGESYCVLVVRSDHYSNFLRIFALVFQQL